MPLLVCVSTFLFLQMFAHVIEGHDFLRVCAGLVLFSTPSVIPILFIRRRLFNLWYPVALAYLVFGTIFLVGQNSASGGLPISISEQFVYAVDLAVAFFVVTFLWSIIHTLILRHQEKKTNQAVVK